MKKLVELNEGRNKVLKEGSLQEVVQYLEKNPEVYNWVNDNKGDYGAGEIEMPDLKNVGSAEDLIAELSKVDLGWWSLDIIESMEKQN